MEPDFYNDDVSNVQVMKKNTIIIDTGTGPLIQEAWDPRHARFLIIGLACT
jgi:lipoate synthase